MTLYPGKRPDVAETLLGRDTRDQRLVVEAVRPKAQTWRLDVEHEVARSVLGQVARHHLDDGDPEADLWLVDHKYAERLVEVLANRDAEGLLALIAQKIRTTEQEK